jgi:hypothetical protein
MFRAYLSAFLVGVIIGKYISRTVFAHIANLHYKSKADAKAKITKREESYNYLRMIRNELCLLETFRDEIEQDITADFLRISNYSMYESMRDNSYPHLTDKFVLWIRQNRDNITRIL